MKKLLILTVIVLQNFISLAQGFDAGGITYLINRGSNPSSVNVTGRSGTQNSIVIPNTVTSRGVTYDVIRIEDNAFEFIASITSAVIGNNVTSIGVSAFDNNNLDELTIGNKVERIEDFAFSGNNLTSVTIPNSVISIGDDAFFRNKELTTLSLSDNITSIGRFGFFDCKLNSVTIPSGLTSIDGEAFGMNENATSLTVNSFLSTNIPTYDNFFVSGSTLANSKDERSNINLSILPGTEQAYNNAGWDLNSFKSVKFDFEGIQYEIISPTPTLPSVKILGRTEGNTNTEIIIPESITPGAISYNVTEVEDNAFLNDDLTNVNIPSTITSIGNNAFGIDPTAISITVTSTINTNIPTYNGFFVSKTGSSDPVDERSKIDLTVPSGTEQLYLDAGWLGFKSLTTPTTTFIADGLVYQVNTPLIPPTVTVIGRAETNTSTEINIPETVTNNGIMYNVTVVGDNAFAFQSPQTSSKILRSNITSAKLSTNARSNTIFSGNKLTSVTFPNTLTKIGDNSFSDNELSNIIIPNSVENIGQNAFSGNQITSVVAEGTTPPTLEPNSFQNNNGITLTIPAGTSQAYTNASWTTNTAINIVIENDTTLSTEDFSLNNLVSFIQSSSNIEIQAPSGIRLENYSIYSISGSNVQNGTTTIISTESLDTGVYILQNNFNKGILVEKIIIQ